MLPTTSHSTGARMFAALLLLTLSLLSTACVPERVVWSPDGTRAAVLGEDGLHLCDADGKIGPCLVADATRVAWLPDGKHVVVALTAAFKTWNDMAPEKPHVPQANVAAVKAALLAGNGNWDSTVSAWERAGSPGDLADPTNRLAGMMLRDTYPTLPAAVRDLLKSRPEFQSYSPTLCQVFELAGNEARPGALLGIRNEGDVIEIRVSPTGAYVALTITRYEQKSQAPPLLMVSPVAPTPDDDDAFLGYSSAFPDWSPDGKSLVFIRPCGPGANRQTTNTTALADAADYKVGALSRQRIIDDAGKLIDRTKWPASEDLAGTVFDPLFRVRCLADGRIFFSSVNVTLPATPADLPTHPSVFMVNPGRQAIVTRVLPHSVDDAGDAAEFFEPSPNGKFLSLPSADGTVAVVTVATGEVLRVQTKPMATPHSFNLTSVPTWRNNDELTFVRPISATPTLTPEITAREVVRCTVSGPPSPAVILSGNWDLSVAEKWLRPDQATQPK